MAKRGFDVVCAALGLLALMPALLVLAGVVRFVDGAPVLFRQTRAGRHGRPFTILKFRTLTIDESDRAQVSDERNDRITPLGRVLRRTKLDELPQLFNVLIGDMSIVGPRPELLRYVDQWPANEREIILSTRPGLTDPVTLAFMDEAQILARSEDPERYYLEMVLPLKLKGYCDYVRSQSLMGDLVIVWQTVVRLVRRFRTASETAGVDPTS